MMSILLFLLTLSAPTATPDPIVLKPVPVDLAIAGIHPDEFADLFAESYGLAAQDPGPTCLPFSSATPSPGIELCPTGLCAALTSHIPLAIGHNCAGCLAIHTIRISCYVMDGNEIIVTYYQEESRVLQSACEQITQVPVLCPDSGLQIMTWLIGCLPCGD